MFIRKEPHVVFGEMGCHTISCIKSVNFNYPIDEKGHKVIPAGQS